MDRRSLLGTAVVVTTAAMGGLSTNPAFAATSGKKPPAPRNIALRRAVWADGAFDGTQPAGGALAFGQATGTTQYTDPKTGVTSTYETATWTGPVTTVGFAVTEMIPSWTASTPGGSFVRIEIQASTVIGTTTKWYNLGNWAADDALFTRTSVAAQGDDDAFVAIDTLVARDGRAFVSWRLRVTLLRPQGSASVPVVKSLHAMSSTLPEPGKLDPSTPQRAQGVVLDVPRYSQEIHIGEYPQWDGGGEAWCSPTSTSMILSYWGTGPSPEDYAWVDPSYQDPWVDYAARHTFDFTYNGCGNWPFNTAYAGRFGLDGFVTRLRSLNEAEQFIAAGIPLIASASWKKNQIPGLEYGTNGHIMVLAGFTNAGDPILNDPFSPTNADVRKPVGRAEWESAWLNTSRGVVYVIRPESAALPTPPDQANW